MIEVLQKFEPVSLSEIERAKLLSRVDTKYIFSLNQLSDIMYAVMPFYYILEINGLRNMEYYTQYYDTPDFQLYLMHQNKRQKRFKIRFRKYVNSDTKFLEIKQKDIKCRTIKSRLETEHNIDELTENEKDFVALNSPFSFGKIEKKTENFFKRITLVHKINNERITIDNNLLFRMNILTENKMQNVVILEAKQEKFNLDSEILKTLRSMAIRPLGFSKYCIGTYLLNKNLKGNYLKSKLLKVDKILSIN